jgi:hypothetical protein
MMRILRMFAAVRKLEEEVECGKRALESADRYATALEAVKKLQAERIAELEARIEGGK